MDYMQLIQELKRKSDDEAFIIAKQYGVDLSIQEIRKLRPLLDEISFHWLFTGIPESFVKRTEQAIGKEKTRYFLQQYSNFNQ